jgi:hypothetical protein
MNRRPLRSHARTIPRFIVAGVVAAAAGLGIGSGVSLVADDDSRAVSSTSTAPAPNGTGSSSTRAVRVRVVSAYLELATTRRGRSRDRARLSVNVRVTNGGKNVIEHTSPVLMSKTRVRPDPLARSTTGSLLRPIPPAVTAGGRLRFETAGAVTRQLVATRWARLRIAGRTVPVSVKLGPPPG